jgi:cytidylate kinase
VPVVTISRQFGAAGLRVGRLLAQQFGAEFLDRAIVAQVALRSGIPESQLQSYDERLPSIWQRLASALASGAPDIGTLPTVPEDQPALSIHERLVQTTRTLVEEAAARGNAVIVGRGGAFILARRPGVLNVQLVADLDDRVRYLLSRADEAPEAASLDESALRELCSSVDAARAEYVRSIFGADWMDARHYDLVVDTGRLGVSRTIELIALAARTDGSTE